jgi:hypothetical protein
MIHDIFSKWNLDNILKIIHIGIYQKPGLMEHIMIGDDYFPQEIELYMSIFKELCDVFSQYYEEMPDIDPHIVEH